MNCRTSNAVCLFAAAFATLAFLAPVVAGSGDARREPRRFIFTTKPAAIAGCTMVCPAHEHGTPEQAYEKLTKMLASRPAGKCSSLYVCRVEQLETVKVFAPMVDRVFLNPFIHRSRARPSGKELIWPNLDHPVINQLRQLYRNAGSTPLIACIDLDGDKALYPTRAPSFEEIEWMSLGIIGSGFKGIAWKGRGEAKPWAGRLRRLTSRLKAHASDLGASVPVNWVSSEKGRAYSAMASKDALIVVVLDPRYLRPSGRMEGVAFPVDDQPVSGTLVLCPPEAVTIEAGTKLDGSPVAMRIEDGQLRADYKFHGAGDILILPLKKQNIATNDSCRNAPDAVSRRAAASRRSE